MARKQTPAPKGRFLGLGALIAAIVAVPFLTALLVTGSLRSSICLIPCIAPLALYALNRLHGLALLMVARHRWRRTPVCGVLVYSDSPNWKEYIERNWLPRLAGRVIILNWSQRQRWPRSLPVHLFAFFVMGYWRFGPLMSAEHRPIFNPSVILLRGIRYPYVYRYYYAFHDAKHGNMEALRRLETHMFAQFEGA